MEDKIQKAIRIIELLDDCYYKKGFRQTTPLMHSNLLKAIEILQENADVEGIKTVLEKAIFLKEHMPLIELHKF